MYACFRSDGENHFGGYFNLKLSNFMAEIRFFRSKMQKTSSICPKSKDFCETLILTKFHISFSRYYLILHSAKYLPTLKKKKHFLELILNIFSLFMRKMQRSDSSSHDKNPSEQKYQLSDFSFDVV